MPLDIVSPFTSIGSWEVRSFTLLLGIAVALTMVLFMHSQRPLVAWGSLVDSALLTIILGIFAARALHVWLHWEYFARQPTEILQLRMGGLNWHGALLGAALGIGLVARWRKSIRPKLWATLCWAIPIFALAGWRACISARCAYGREIATLYGQPAWLADWGADIFTRIAPRYNTITLGSLFACGLFILNFWLSRRDMPALPRLALLLMSLATGMFCIGFLRGDPIVVYAGLRTDQWLDLLVLLMATLIFSRTFHFHLRANSESAQEIPSSPTTT